MEFSIVDKKVQMTQREIIKYQLMTHCFVNRLQLSDSELDCLTLLAAYKECELSDFCNSAVDEKIFKTSQTVRNFLTKIEKIGNLIIKSGTSRKKIILNPALKIQSEGNILLDFKIYHVAS